jgi:diguanylate cyclase (GGDEF)-like protein/PAS domain S-box-containing protein
MVAGLGGIVVLLVLALALTFGVLEIKSGLRAYVTAESLWSTGKQEAVHFLHRYASSGEQRFLERAIKGIAGPMGYRQARLGLQQDNPDIKAARRGFAQGGSHAEDVPKLITLFRYFSNVSYFEEAVAIWVRSDDDILELNQLIQSVEQGELSPERLQAQRERIDAINDNLRDLAQAFSETLGSTDRSLSLVLFFSVSLVFLLATLVAMKLFWSAARRLTLSEKELRATLDNAGVGMALVDRYGMVRSVNSQLCEIVEQTQSELTDNPLDCIPGADSQAIDLNTLNGAFARGQNRVTLERSHTRKDGQTAWLRFKFSIVGDDPEHPNYYIMVVEDASEEHLRVERLSHEATHDPLTGLSNRREFIRRLESCLLSLKTEQARHVLCFVDLDKFKEVNDSSGHRAGDAMLVGLSGVLRSTLRDGDTLARLGGDEFGIILSHCPLDVAKRIAEQIRNAVESWEFQWEERCFQVTASIGIMELKEEREAQQAADVLDAADHGCYQAKHTGRNRVYVVSPLIQKWGSQSS